jgi:competence protein ComEC
MKDEKDARYQALPLGLRFEISDPFHPSSAAREAHHRPCILHPFLYLTAALIAGVLVDRWLEPDSRLTVALIVLSIILSIRFLLTGNSTAATAALLVAFIQAGTLVASVERASTSDARLKQLYEAGRITPDTAIELTGRLVAPPEPAPKATYLDLEAESILSRSEAFHATGRARLMLMLDRAEAVEEFNRLQLDYGSRVRVLVRLERARSYKNPASPDFNDYLERSGYDLKGVIKSSLLIERIGAGRVNPLLGLLYKARLGFMKAIDKHFEPRAAGTLKAMLVDNRHFLDPKASAQLREGATFHVLSISGMHVAIIAWALLGGQTKPKRRRAPRLIISIAALWAYAVMVGLAPPVTRATVMITVGLTGPLLFRRAASINTVALAAFIMLALKPALVADPAFQLSFIAVAGIVGLALPIAERLRAVGEWRPSAHTPHPPSCSRAIRVLAETLFWDERKFNDEMRRSPVRYRLEKARAARWLGRLRLQRLARATALLIITSLAIQLSTLPLMAVYFNRVSPVGILLNVVAGLLTGFLMLAAMLIIVTGAISASLAAWLGTFIEGAHYLLVNSVVPFRDLPGASFRVAHYEGWRAGIYAVYFVPLSLLAVLIDRWQPVARKLEVITDAETRLRVCVSALCILALIASMIAVLRPASPTPSGKLTIHFLDVGQGDAALIIFPGGATMLVDGGGEPSFNTNANHENTETDFKDASFGVGETVVSRFLWSLGLTRIDYLLVTHAHTDHIGGLSQVVDNFRVGQAIIGHAPDDNAEFDHFREAVGRQAVPVGMVSAGCRFEIQGVAVEVLWPPVARSQVITSGNDDSVVLRLCYGAVSALLAGDIEQPSEDALVQSGVALQADVLKVPHHGSRTSSSASFIDAVRPASAVISVGDRSRFGHPHADVLERYLARSAKLYQTGRDGMVTVETDGATIDLRTYKTQPMP